jgi:hypothetical protein
MVLWKNKEDWQALANLLKWGGKRPKSVKSET